MKTEVLTSTHTNLCSGGSSRCLYFRPPDQDTIPGNFILFCSWIFLDQVGMSLDTDWWPGSAGRSSLSWTLAVVSSLVALWIDRNPSWRFKVDLDHFVVRCRLISKMIRGFLDSLSNWWCLSHLGLEACLVLRRMFSLSLGCQLLGWSAYFSRLLGPNSFLFPVYRLGYHFLRCTPVAQETLVSHQKTEILILQGHSCTFRYHAYLLYLQLVSEVSALSWSH